MIVLTKPMILVTVEQCAKYLHSFKGVSLDWYINGTYTLPMAIYSDSGNYSDDERYIHNSISNINRERLEEIVLALG